MRRSRSTVLKERRRAVLERAISLTVERMPSVTPSLRSRWRNLKRDVVAFDLPVQEVVPEPDPESGGGLSVLHGECAPPPDDLSFFDSFEDAVPEELRVRICKDAVRQNLLDYWRSHVGNVHLLESVEHGSVRPEELLEASPLTSPQEKNAALLWCALVRRADLVRVLLERCDADLHWHCEPDAFTALHLAALSGDTDTCRLLISKGGDVNGMPRRYTPLHCAAFGNSPEAIRLLLESGAHVRNCGGAGGSVLHSAVKANAVEVLRLLLDVYPDVNCVEPGGCSALHLAADLGRAACLEVLLEVPGVDPGLRTREKGATALHLAAENGYGECVSLLLAKGASVGDTNKRGQTPLHLAARAQSVECVETLLATGKCAINVQDCELRTPLHYAVGRALQAHEVAAVLLDRGADADAADRYGYTPLHVAALNELSQCVETLLEHGADVCARTHGGATALSLIVRKTPAALGVVYHRLDAAISMHDPEVSHREVELRLDFRHLLRHGCPGGEMGYLKTFVDEGQKGILEHPLSEAFLHLKWEKIRKFYVARLVFCFLYVLGLTLYVMAALAPSSSDSLANATSPDSASQGGLQWREPAVVKVVWYVLVLLTACEVCRKVYGLAGYTSLRRYVEQRENLTEWYVIGSVFATSFVYTGRTYVWQSHVGAAAVLLAWSNLMLMIGQLPALGSYVAMYTRVQTEFAKLLLAYSCLLIGFAVSFCVIFPSSMDFADPLIGLVKVLVMMTGELDFQSLLLTKSQQPTFLKVSAHVIFVIFLLLVTVVLMNLLVGIAVHDIQGLQKTAGLAKLERQTRLIAYIEAALFNKYLPSCLMRLLQLTALVSPSAYRVVLHVKPLNRREKRLPRDVLASAYQLARQRKKCQQYTISSRGSVATAAFSDGTSLATLAEERPAAAKAAVEKLSEEVAEVKKMLEEQRLLLDNVLKYLKSGRDSDC